jgi:tetratricopeptide (TPR) repeat protein
LSDARDWLEEHEENLVLLCDDPTFWGGPSSEETGFFSARAADVTRLLVEQARCRRVVAGRIPESLTADDVVDLTPDAPDREWLLDRDSWGDLADAAVGLEETGAPLEHLTALELRLAVALSALRDPLAAADAISERSRQPNIATKLWDVVAGDPSLTKLKRAWLRLSFVRRPFEGALLNALKLEELRRKEHALVRHCLVFGDEHQYRLHEVVRAQARTWLREQSSPSRRQVELHASGLLANYYLERFAGTASRGQARAVIESMEAFYFVTLSGNSALRSRVTPYFTEQLDALGWRLSYVHRRFDDATSAFREAISWDDDDDYAHHYLAFNLDRQGKAPAEVEHEYERAIEINPDNSWWHARYIAFLAHRGRIADARHRWDDSQVVLGVAERHSDRFLFETLHLWVAEALLDRAELSFAREVLDEIPEWARRPDILPAYARLRRRLTALSQAAGIGALVPAHRLTSRWWEDGPELLQDRVGEDSDSHRVRWLAARVDAIDQDGVHLRAASIDRDQTEPPSVGRMVIELDTFRRLCRDDERVPDLEPGWHAEIGVYASRSRPEAGTTTLIRLHRPRPADWGDEPVFDSARYLRRAVPAH